ncbi:two-component regulator propeller domain-containing protein [Bacteroides sp. AN502(2024)]|uniref:hybrid sensor histidine kinase/response regulator transcription factor n=1 Tax=Bacteroides sp. AN502(2024) TaxID=3160599 RepID=UPI0035121BB5
MKNKRYVELIIKNLILLVFSIQFSASLFASEDYLVTNLKFRQFPALNNLQSDEIQKIYQDKDGFIWLASRYGFYQYDGYETVLYKSNLYTPGLLTNNNILCLADDYEHNLWIGTQEGLNILNKKTGAIKKILSPTIPNNVISCLLVMRDHSVWLGTDSGLCKYDAKEDSFVVYNRELTGGVLDNTAIKSLLEDSEGDLWIGTWSSGLYRYVPSTGKFYAYPAINERNSAHVIYEDTNKNIWVGSWSCGLFRLDNPKNLKMVSYVNYRHKAGDDTSLSDDIVYDISEDLNTGTLWIGTRSGLSIMDKDASGRFINYKSSGSSHYIFCDEINTVLRDKTGMMWLGSIGGGVLAADTSQPMFASHCLDFADNDIPVTSVRALFTDSERNIWMGIGTYGLACLEAETDKLKSHSQIPEFAGMTIPTVYSVMQRRNGGEIWFGTYDGGIFIYRKGQKVKNLKVDNCTFLGNSCVSALYEDKHGNCWVGTRGSLGVLLANGKSFLFGPMTFADKKQLDWVYVRDIIADGENSVWIATSNYGLIHILGDIHQPSTLKYVNYSFYNGLLVTNNALCLYKDKSERLWVGTDGGGLYLYDCKNDCFDAKNKEYNIPGDMVGSIEEDKSGNLWLGTNAGLVKLGVQSMGQDAVVRVYTEVDGLQGNFFISRSACSRDGELFFGGYRGYNSFRPEDMEEKPREVSVAITDIKIFNRSITLLPLDIQRRISQFTPSFTQKIELPYPYNNFSIEFATLTYKNPEQNRYAYRLDGFDEDWVYTNADRRFAYYNNLKSGTYTFRLKATNENGIWSGYVRELTVVVLPPFWATWWAYVLYVLFVAGMVFWLFRITRNRILLQNELRVREMEKMKAEELNHAKLQFFTNITHELLTPLTIISATVDELKAQVPRYTELYTVMYTNVHRLIRLLQQILEFRKAETGNLKLRVSFGDIAAFVRKEAEGFQPLIKKSKIHFSVLCNPDSIMGYFDTDKLDKILYNLLSNAAKYTEEGGFIQVTLSYAEDRDHVLLKVKDNGKGISEEKQKTLFQRFYEGDYRKFNTIGTGIGLSLTKDLVELHEGTISVQSETGQGAEFIVCIPIDRSYFREDQIDEETIVSVRKMSIFVDEEDEQTIEEPAIEKKKHSVLVIEDNEELLQLMMRLLKREYNVFTAENGKEGIIVLENEDIDLIVSDVMMPEMDGIEFCKYVKSNLEISHIPVILLTAKNKEEDRAEAYEVGADAFISKPFSLSVFYARIRNLLKHKEGVGRDFKHQLVFELKDLNYTSLDEDFLQRAIDCVNGHLEDAEFDQPQFADEMKTSKSTLYKKLKSLTGLNTSAFIRNVRLKSACRIMEEKGSNIRISELAYAVGFNDPKYFSSCFKKEFGMLPSEYIERFLTDTAK